MTEILGGTVPTNKHTNIIRAITNMRKNFYNRKLQLIGWYNGRDKAYRKVVSNKKHLLKIMDAWGIERYVIDDLTQKYETKQIRIKETDKNEVFIISIEDFLKHAVERNFETTQMFVSRKYFKKI